MNRETVKPLLLIAVFAICAIIEHLPYGVAVMLSLVHVGVLAICGELIRIPVGLQPNRSHCDRIVVDYMLGWCFVPILALIACLFGSRWIALGMVAVICGAFVVLRRKKHSHVSIAASESIPLSLYVIAALFAIISVAVPFSCFSSSSIMREFYGDAVQRFGVIYALSKEIPMHNPFFAGAPLRYYWLWMFPYAQEFKYICSDLFTVWKCGQTLTAICFPLGLWCLLRRLLENRLFLFEKTSDVDRHREAAYVAVLFALIFTSYEIFANPILLQKTAGVFGIHYGISAYAATTVDPDFSIGILQPYSDQLLTEDFLYIPQNTYAIVVVLAAVAALTAGNVGIGALILSGLAGTNAFFAPPAFVAYLIVCIALYGGRSGLIALCALGAGSSICMAMCGIIGSREILLMTATFVAVGLIASVNKKTEMKYTISEKALQFWAVAMLVSFGCIVALSPIHNTAALMLGYGPPIVFGIYYLVQLARKRNTGLPFIVFLLVFCTVYAFTTVFISLQSIKTAPEWLRGAAIYTGRELNLFNFYHKSGKMVRLAWAVFGVMGLIALQPQLKQIVQKRKYLVVLGSACLLLSATTAVIRPFTYIGHVPVCEADAAAYLKTAGCNETVLIEDYRTSEINELAPVRVFYYSQWSNGNSGLNTLSGTWADQYLPAKMRRFSAQREQQVNDFFASNNAVCRLAFLNANHIGFILTRRPYDLTGVARLVVNKPGGYLYRVHGIPAGLVNESY